LSVSDGFAGSFESKRSFEGQKIPARVIIPDVFAGSFESQRSFEGQEIPASVSVSDGFAGSIGFSCPRRWGRTLF